MYRLNQWAGDFPMLWEPQGSFTPLFTSQPEELAFSKSMSLHLHISASCLSHLLFFFVPIFSALFLIFSIFCMNSSTGSADLLCCHSQLILWQPCLLYDRHTDNISAYAGEFSPFFSFLNFFFSYNDWPCLDTARTSDEKSPVLPVACGFSRRVKTHFLWQI